MLGDLGSTNDGGELSACHLFDEARADENDNRAKCDGQFWIPQPPPPDPYGRQYRPREDRAALEPAFQVFGEILGGAITCIRFAVETADANCLQVAVGNF